MPWKDKVLPTDSTSLLYDRVDGKNSRSEVIFCNNDAAGMRRRLFVFRRSSAADTSTQYKFLVASDQQRTQVLKYPVSCTSSESALSERKKGISTWRAGVRLIVRCNNGRWGKFPPRAQRKPLDHHDPRKVSRSQSVRTSPVYLCRIMIFSLTWWIANCPNNA